MSVTIRDIARELGISAATVSLALNGRSVVSIDTAKKVRETAAAMGYVPNQYARGLAGGRTGIIAVILPDLRDNNFASFYKCLAKELKSSRFEPMLHESNRDIGEERRVIERAIQREAEAIIIVPAKTSAADKEYADMLNSLNTPIVFGASRYSGVAAPCSMSDIEGGMREVTGHMFEMGGERVALLTAPERWYVYDICEKGYASVVRAHGFEPEIYRISELDYQFAYEHIMALPTLPDAFVCVNDQIAIGVINALNARGVKIPVDVMVSGFGDGAYSRLSPVPLTTIRRDIPKIASGAVGLALARIANIREQLEDIFVPCELLVKDSTLR